MIRESILATIFLSLSACGGAPSEPATPPTPPAETAAPAAPVVPSGADAAKPSEPTPAGETAPAADAAPAHPAWQEGMTKDAQIAFMKKYVLPEMEPVFKSYNAKRYAKFDCKTCHGPLFKEPDEFLPKLTLKDGQLTAFKDKPEIAKFMAEEVVPHMAKAMGLKPYDPATHQGFGCAGCHKIEVK